MEIAWHPEALSEFDAGIDWYTERDEGLGERFEESTLVAIEAVVGSPHAWAPWPGWGRESEVRSKMVEGFPYRVVYLVHGDRLVIIAVAHSRRYPGYWRERTGV